MPNNHRSQRNNSGRASRGVRNRNRTLSEETTQIAGMTVTIVRKAIKNMYLRIKPPNAQIVISAPSRMSQAAIARFVTERKPWIERARRTMLQAKDEQIRQSDFNGLDRVNGSHGPDNLNGLENSGGVGDRNNPGDPNSLNNPRVLCGTTRRRNGPYGPSMRNCRCCLRNGRRLSDGSRRMSRYAS